MPASPARAGGTKVYVKDEPYNVNYYYVMLREERDVEITASDWKTTSIRRKRATTATIQRAGRPRAKRGLCTPSASRGH